MDKLEILSSKIFLSKDDENLKRKLAFWQFKGQKIVFTNGCFDILHRGHAEYLAKASDLGHVLVVGLNSDASVKRLKGQSRPVQDEYTRALLLASLQVVEAVVLFEEDTPASLIEVIKPSVLVKGGDYKPEEIAGAEFVTKNGGTVEIIPLTEGFSTSNIVEKR
jgi:rfaE bifunctional protein nucleotidyltransferase chain/domain